MDIKQQSIRAALEADRPQALRSFPDGRLAWPVIQLCREIGISRSHYYELELVGMGPRKLQVGRKPMITADAAREWLTSLEERGEEARKRLKELRARSGEKAAA